MPRSRRVLAGAVKVKVAGARRYLGGEPLLFPDDTEALDRALLSLRALGSLFNEHVATPLQQLTAADAAVELGDNDALTELITDRSAYLVDPGQGRDAALVGGRRPGGDADEAVGMSGNLLPDNCA